MPQGVDQTKTPVQNACTSSTKQLALQSRANFNDRSPVYDSVVLVLASCTSPKCWYPVREWADYLPESLQTPLTSAMQNPAYAAPAARGISKRCHCIGGTAGATQASNYGMTQTQSFSGVQPALIGSYAAQSYYPQDGGDIKLRDARGVNFEPQTSYTNHYPEKVSMLQLSSREMAWHPSCSRCFCDCFLTQ